MMMMGKKDKGIGSIIVSRMSPMGETERMGQKSKQSDYESGYDSCCEGIFDAVKSGDKESFKSELKNMIDMMINERELIQDEE